MPFVATLSRGSERALRADAVRAPIVYLGEARATFVAACSGEYAPKSAVELALKEALAFSAVAPFKPIVNDGDDLSSLSLVDPFSP